MKTAQGCAGTFDPSLSGKGVGGFLQVPFAEWIQGLQLLQELGMKIGAETARCSLSDSVSHGHGSTQICWCPPADRDEVMCEES